MKKRIALFLTFMLFTLPALAKEVEKTTVAWESGLKPPYLMLDSNGRPTGIAVEIVTEILKRNQIRVTHKMLPWKRCLKQIKERKVDLVPNASYKKKRAEFAYYTDPLYETHLVLYYNKEKFSSPPEITSIEQLKPYKVGGVLGFNYSRYDGKIRIDTGSTDRVRLVNKLRKKRVDFAILQKEVILARQKMGEVDLTGLGTIPNPAKPVKASHVLTVKNQKGEKLREIINAGLKELSKDGTIDRINRKYLGTN